MNTITPAVIEAAMRELSTKNLAPQTVLHYCKFLRRILNVAVRDGWLERNPFARVTLPTVKARRTRFLSSEEEARLLQQLGPTYGPWARIAILTGMRQAEQFSTRWADLDIDHGVLTLPATKAGQVQYVRLNEEAKDILRRMQAVAEGVRTARAALGLARRHQVEMPITQEINAVLFEGKSCRKAVSDLMERDAKPEKGRI